MPIDDEKVTRAYNRGLKHEKAGKVLLAAKAYRECLALDPADFGGVAIRLASLGEGSQPDGAPPAYVATLFDQHADVFDDILVEQLGYAVPLMVPNRLTALKLERFPRMLDLGCGTGLTGEAMRARADVIMGVDLSEAILGVADERGCYDDLYLGEAVAFIAGWDEAPFDLITATDVLPYLGTLDVLFPAVAKGLNAGGVFVFSTETLSDEAFGERDWKVGPHQRFHHKLSYVEATLKAAALTVLHHELIVVRTDESEPQHGHLVVAGKK
jgi:predicted TPR repeat methyltransferase